MASPPSSAEHRRALAADALGAFERVADAARHALDVPMTRSPLEAFAVVNQATADVLLRDRIIARDDKRRDLRRLLTEPAIARLVVRDENDREEVFFVTRGGTVDGVGVRLCSYLGPKGALASWPVGEERELRLPGGKRWFEVVERATFSPVLLDQWDARPAAVQVAGGRPFTLRSLRDELRAAGATDDVIDALDLMMRDEEGDANLVNGLQHDIQTAMQLRVRAILDEVQSDIFRLPLNSRLALLGPAGTGKTTTLIKRLRQKIDWEHLDEDERRSVGGPEQAERHATDWLMFTPTDLLKRYVQEAFNQEDVPAPAGRIQTWTDYRADLARQRLPILRSNRGAGFEMKPDLITLLPSTITDQIAWYEDFDADQRGAFVAQLTAEVERLAASAEPGLVALGEQFNRIFARSGGAPLLLLSDLAAEFDGLQRELAGLRETTRRALRQPLALHVRRDPDALDALARFVATLGQDRDDDGEEGEADADGDEEEDAEALPAGSRRAAEAAFVRAVRAQAIARANRRSPPRANRSAQVLDWITNYGIALPPLDDLGARLLVQRAGTRLLRAGQIYLRGLPARYRSFRRTRAAQGRWYAALDEIGVSDVSPLEVDAILLATLREAAAIGADTVLRQRLGARVPALVGDVAALRRNQILVDEMTDFSPLQLACMATLAAPGPRSFFACGDFNQRLTPWGSRSPEELRWLFGDLQLRNVNIAYRQSRRLTEFAARLVSATDGAGPDMPSFVEHEGLPPVLGGGLADPAAVARWLAARIGEVERLTGYLPSTAMLVNDRSDLEPLAAALNDALAAVNLRAIAYPDGQALGGDGDVRLFEARHIKGLQFEAVFFVGVDRLAERDPDLFSKYLYVGATRAATYLGLTTAGATPHPGLASVADLLAERWAG